MIDVDRTAAAWGAEIVHDHTLSGPFYARGRGNAPVVTTNHGVFDGELRTMYRSMGADVPIIAISHHQASTACGIDVATVIHHGMEVPGGPAVRRGPDPCAVPRPHEPRQGGHRGDRHRPQGRYPAQDRSQDARARRTPVLPRADRTAPRAGVDYLGEVRRTSKMRCSRGALSDQPHPVAGAVRPGHARGTRLRHAGGGFRPGAAAEIVVDGVTGFLANDPRLLVDALGHVESLDRSTCRAVAETRFSAERMAEDHARVLCRGAGGTARSRGMTAPRTTASKPWNTTVPPSTLSRGDVTMVEEQTFCIADRSGNIAANVPEGLFVLDQRVLSQFEMRLNGNELEPLAVVAPEPFAATFAVCGVPADGIPDAHVVVFRTRHIGNGMRERITITNYGVESTSVEIQVDCDADFASVFEVKKSRVGPSWARGRGRRRHHRVRGRGQCRQATEREAPRRTESIRRASLRDLATRTERW